jgi:endonuclease YncB( thermonuclease family)
VAILWCAFFFNSDVDALSSRAVEVGRVVDGDTVVLTSGEIVRLAGINTPERETDQKTAEPLADAAYETLVETLSKGNIFLEEALDKTDRYGRTLAYLFLEDGRSVQEILIKQGLASVVVISPNDRYLNRFALAEDAARASGAGIWSIPYFDVAGADQIRGGFQFILDEFTALKLGPKWFRFSVRDDLDVLIRRADWEAGFDYPPGLLAQAAVAVRGWISKKTSKGVLVISHPFMLERCVVEKKRLCPSG